MKLLLENWKKFLKEQEINEATQEELQYLDDALKIPIGELPFGNIFGNSYRIIEPVNTVKKETPLARVIFALNKFGWEVDPASDFEYHDETAGDDLAGKIKSGKILCRKTKVTHFIDGKGKPGISRKTTVINLPKLMAGIIKFIEQSRPNLQKEFNQIFKNAILRYRKNEIPEDAVYDAKGTGIGGLMETLPLTANEYRKIMSLIDSQIYFLDMKRLSNETKYYFNAIGVDYENFKDFSDYAINEFDDLVANMDQYLDRNYIIYSRHPVDVFRMADHQSITSCHALPSMKGDVEFDQYNQCALSEVYGNGMIAYAVPAKNFKMFPPTQESLDKFEDREIFFDQMRQDATSDLITPTSRIRIKNVAFHKDSESEPVRLAVSQAKIYGPRVPGFRNAVNSKLAKTQEKEIKEVIKQGAMVLHYRNEPSSEPTIFLSDFTRYGGSYQDTGYSVAETLPMLFRKIDSKLVFKGSEVKYNKDIEDALMLRIGARQLSYDEIRYGLELMFQPFNEQNDNLDFRARPTYNNLTGDTTLDWILLVSFSFETPGGAEREEVKEIVENIADFDLPKLFDLPKPDNYYLMGRDVSENWSVEIVYNNLNFGTNRTDRATLRSEIPNVIKKMEVFQEDYENGAIKLILNKINSSNVSRSSKHFLNKFLSTNALPEESQWPEIDREYINDTSGIEFIAFEKENYISLTQLLDSVPEDKKEEAMVHAASGLNGISKSDELASKIALNKGSWDPKKDPTIIISFADMPANIGPEDLVNDEEIVFKASLSMFNDYSQEVLMNTAHFLKSKANIEDISKRLERRLKHYILKRLSSKRSITENKKRLKIRVRR